MKKFFCLLLIQLFVGLASAQDVIVKKDGNTILSKVLEVRQTEVKYKKWSNLDGPEYVIAIAELLSINYQNGEKDDFSSVPVGNQQTSDKNYHPDKSLSAEEVQRRVEQANPYSLFKKGATATYIIERADKQGKQEKFWNWASESSYIQQYVSDVRVENGALAVYVKLNFLNKKLEPSKGIKKTIKDRVFKIEIDPEGNYHHVHSVMADGCRWFKERRGFGFIVPGMMENGQKLTCGQVAQKTALTGILNFRSELKTYSEWEVAGEGELTVPAGTFQCIKLTGKISSTMNGNTTDERITCWLARGIGIIRCDYASENYRYLLHSLGNIQ